MRSILLTATAVLAAIGIGIGALSASGEAGVRPAPPANHAGLCGEIGSIRGLTVRRVVAFPGNHPRFSFPPVVTVQKVANAQRAARLICALPPMPAGVFNCPADLGISYTFEFATGAVRTDVSVDPWGCETINGALSERWAARSSWFWGSLGAAIGLNDASVGTFEGRIGGM